MANSITPYEGLPANSTMGAMKFMCGQMDWDDGAGGSSVASGLEIIYGGSVTAKSASADLQSYTFNSNVNGDIALGTAASGDDFYVTVWGK